MDYWVENARGHDVFCTRHLEQRDEVEKSLQEDYNEPANPNNLITSRELYGYIRLKISTWEFAKSTPTTSKPTP